MTGLLRSDAGAVIVNGARRGSAEREELMPVRADLGMIFQEGALFDSLTVRENVGYKLYEETRHAARGGRSPGRGGARLRRISPSTSTRCRRSSPADSAGAWRSLAPWPSSQRILLYDEATTGLDPITATTVDDEIIKLRDLEGVTSIVVTHQLRDAFYIATHMATRDPTGRCASSRRRRRRADETEFIMLKDGVICFEGDAMELRESRDPYLQTFLS